jgi:replication factor C subunit 1
MWTSIYSPSSIKNLLGNPVGIKKITDWVRNYKSTQSIKMLLIIGKPGLGKTTAVNLIGKSLDYTVNEFNASDTRSPTMVKELIFDNYSLDGYFDQTKSINVKKQHLILMDEVDGMQPAGITELIKLSETSKSPIICICNFETTAVQKLSKHVEKVYFYPIQTKDILNHLNLIIKKQYGAGFDGVSNDDLASIIESNNGDIRKTINQLQYICLKCLKFDTNDQSNTTRKKQRQSALDNDDNDDNTNVTDVDDATQSAMSLDTIFNSMKHLINSHDKSINYALQHYYNDSMFVPLFIHENCLSCVSENVWDITTTNSMYEICESISMGDIISNQIYTNQSFELIPLHGIYTTYVPVKNMKLQVNRVTFPKILGKLSSQNSRLKSIEELSDKMTKSLGGMERPVSLERLECFKRIIQQLLLQNNSKCVIQLLRGYRLTNEDFKNIFILTGDELAFKDIDKKTKAIITKGLK